ncbi:MAG: ATP-dependent helicase [Chloroflexota bacterium]
MLSIEGLNPAQQEAVRTIDGPVLILAGPGSGKTRVIVHRIAHMMDQEIHPANILSVTFTNRAAKEMRERIESLVGETRARYLTMGTFHSTCARWLRRDGEAIGVDRNFVIFDDHDQMDLVKRIMKEMELDEKRLNPRSFLSGISSAKSELVGVHRYAEHAKGPFEEQVGRIYRRYQQMLDQSLALDFDDLIGTTVRLFRESPETLERYRDRYRYIMVDEFQDTNVAQYQLVKILAARDRNIAVVGDPDQSIYGWRRADIRNILNFEDDFPGLKIVTLEQNYRSTQKILDAAQAIISANTLRKPKNLWTDNPSGAPIVLHDAFDERDEAAYVIRELSRLVHQGEASLADIAVMYRTNAQSRALEDALVRAGIPYRLVGGTRFYERKEIKDLLCYLRLIQNPHDIVSFERMINVPPRGIGTKTMTDLANWSRQIGMPSFQALELLAAPNATQDERTRSAPFATRALKGLLPFHDLVVGLRTDRANMTLVDLIDAVLERTGYERFLRDGSEEGEDRWSNVGELRTKAEDYEGMLAEESLPALLEEVSLVQDVDTMEPDASVVTLITLHQAKGLEYPTVFITGMEDGICPHSRSLEDFHQMEEERRLFYVGITRAMQRLYLVHAFRRGFWGASRPSEPSRFLADIPSKLLKITSGGGASAGSYAPSWMADSAGPPRRAQEPPRSPSVLIRPAARQRELDELDEVDGEESAPARRTVTEQQFKAGDRVIHPAFGDGVVVNSRMTGDDEQVEVLFKGNITKKLSMAFAPLQRV